jgi:uncharacterized protein (DUF305 family)
MSSVLCAAACRTAPIVQPGAPGEPIRTVGAAKAADVSSVRHTPADVRFMQDMMGHHAQAIEMVALIPTNSAREEMQLLGRRIELSQADEMALMREWLSARGQAVPSEHAHHAPGARLMPGMLTPAGMARLAAAKGREFDRLFLEGMIKHHAGALTMVEELFSTPGGGQEVEIFSFASDVDADQRIEIERMSALLEQFAREERSEGGK